MDRAGLSANDGPTHHGLFDIAYLRCVPNVIAMAPKDEDELADMMFTATHQNHPTFIRYPRGAAEGVPVKDQPQAAGNRQGARSSRIFRTTANAKSRCSAWATDEHHGAQGGRATGRRKASTCAVINPRFTKPLDAGTHEFFGTRGGRGRDAGRPCADGRLRLGVLELFSEKNVTTPVVRIGWPDQFIEHATTQDELRKKIRPDRREHRRQSEGAVRRSPAKVTRLIEVA